MPAARFYAGRDGQACDGVADHLTLTATDTADGVAHQEDLGKVVATECGSAKALAGAELTLDRDAMVGVNSKVRGAAGGGVGSPVGAVELILKFHL